MVCLTSCVFRSIRFSGFARPHRLRCGARENYTRRRRLRARAGGMSPRDAHKSGDNNSLGGFPESRVPDRPRRWGRTVRRAHYSSGQALMGLPLFISWRKGACLGSPLGDPTGRPRTARRPRPMPSSPDTYTALRPACRFGPQSRTFSRPSSRGRRLGPALWPGP